MTIGAGGLINNGQFNFGGGPEDFGVAVSVSASIKNNGQIVVVAGEGGSDLEIAGTLSLTGTGTIDLGGGGGLGAYFTGSEPGATATLNNHSTIMGGGNIVGGTPTEGATANPMIVNNYGVINGSDSSNAMYISTSLTVALTNAGKIEDTVAAGTTIASTLVV